MGARRKRLTVRTAALSLALAVLGALVTALPASAAVTTSFTPVCGVVGTTVTITGTGFTNMTGVTFDAGGLNPEPAVTFSFVNDTTATAVVPPPASTGKIRVDTPVADTPSAASFVVEPAAPATITSFAPTSGPVGTSVVITGTNFCGTTGVAFNLTAATSFTVDSNTQITATVPAGATTGPLHVTNTIGTADSATNFTVTSAAPTITSFSPTSGPVGTSVVITGTNFTGATAVRFNGTAAAFTINTATQITATVPAGATTGPVSVTTPSGTATSATNFTVTSAAPTITSFSPTSGPVGTSVVITGTNFTGATSVRFNGTAAAFTINTATQITATVPAGATTGKISVTTPGGTATSSASFTVTTGISTHPRTVTFSYRGHRASGNVSVGDGFRACYAFVPVYIQQRKAGSWTLLDTTATNSSGAYRAWVPERRGSFRAQVKKLALPGGITCGGDASPIRS